MELKELKPTAYLYYRVDVDCPSCGHTFDLTEGDDGTFVTPIFNNNWDALEDWECHCPVCEHEFEIQKVEC